ncbi:MAG TPA: glycerol-3-phosphate dehydrogenase C-terminal domain-containing protein, partial [Solirubrobacteraceae bacterium]|nr:glycerol-3-phosphate dehydrogenase C-terminal domain-containing protein [Solirubrobacteraceae bacterium]
RYGHVAHDVLAIAAGSGELAQPIVPGGPADLLAEAVYAARSEQARSVGDALLRRTRLALLCARPLSDGGDAALRVARAMAGELGWDEAEAARQAEVFADEASAEGIVPTP